MSILFLNVQILFWFMLILLVFVADHDFFIYFYNEIEQPIIILLLK